MHVQRLRVGISLIVKETSRLTSVYRKMGYKARKSRKLLARVAKFRSSLNRE